MSLQVSKNKLKEKSLAVIYRGYYKRTTYKIMDFNQELLRNHIKIGRAHV